MPTRPFFSQIFARSPIAPIQEHMKVAFSAAVLLPDYFDHVLKSNWEAAREVGAEIIRLEGEADDIKRNVRSNLSRSLVMPVSRGDLLELLKSQDKIPNRAKDIVGLSLGREMSFPNELGPLMHQFVAKSVSTAGHAMKALEELDELFETGFSGSEIDLISNMISKLNAAEHETDEVQHEVQTMLYKMEKELHPVDVMFLYRIIDWIGDLADNAQSVGNRMLYLIAR